MPQCLEQSHQSQYLDATLHYATLHHITLHCTTVHHTTQHDTLHTPQHTTIHNIQLDNTGSRCFHSSACRCCYFHCVILHCVILDFHCVILNFLCGSTQTHTAGNNTTDIRFCCCLLAFFRFSFCCTSCVVYITCTTQKCGGVCHCVVLCL